LTLILVNGGLALTAASFMGAAALVGVFAVGVMRTAFDFALGFARNEIGGYDVAGPTTD
jgi:nitroalkane oxidase